MTMTTAAGTTDLTAVLGGSLSSAVSGAAAGAETRAQGSEKTVDTRAEQTGGTAETDAKLTLAGGEVTDYDRLANRPAVNDVTLTGNKTNAQLGITAGALGAVVDGDAMTNTEIEQLIGGI